MSVVDLLTEGLVVVREGINGADLTRDEVTSAKITIAATAAVLRGLKELHAQWGASSEDVLDSLAMYEQLGDLLDLENGAEG